MLSLQEVLAKTTTQRKDIEALMDDKSQFYPGDASILKGLRGADSLAVRETLKAVPLQKLIREFLVSGTAGAAYLIPDKIYDIMFEEAMMTDVAPLASNVVSCPGSSLKIDVAVDDQYEAHYFGGGGEQPQESIETTQITCTPKLFGINLAITQELIEDSQFDVLEMHLRQGAKQMGEFSTKMFLADLITCSDGDGTQNAVTTATADQTDLVDLASAWAANAEDGFISDVALTTPSPLTDILSDASVSAYANEFHNRAVTASPLEWGTFMGMTVVLVSGMNTSYTGDGALYISSKWHSFVLNKANAMLTVRKRWLQIKDYAKPVEDLVGAAITARQDQVSVYNDASCELTEGS